jgi:hypothetical protein
LLGWDAYTLNGFTINRCQQQLGRVIHRNSPVHLQQPPNRDASLLQREAP